MSCARASGETSRNLQLAEKYMRECGECPEGLRIRDEINWRGKTGNAGALASSNGVPLENWVRWVAPPRYKYARPKPGFVHLLPHFTDLPIHTQWVLELLQPPVSTPHTGTSSTPTGSGTTTRGTLWLFYRLYACSILSQNYLPQLLDFAFVRGACPNY